jgi:hypothetical protein
MSDLFRLYAPEECGEDGYPLAWHKIDGGPGVKHLVREEAGHRCVRCRHPYVKGAGEWSPCDDDCTHEGPLRWLVNGEWCEDEVGEHWRVSDAREARWRILTVHHLNGMKSDCRWWNLVSLCQRCHLQIQGKVVMERVWPWPHSDWFRPYVAGWYAWSYLGQDLSREEVEARLDELLALELQVR